MSGDATFTLLGSVWKTLPDAVARARSWGADWSAHSKTFVEVRHGRLVAHVGVMEIPATIGGKDQVLAGIHAVCTHEEWRGQGLMRKAMTRALAWVDERYERAVLWANDAAIYGRFGFVAREESMFVGDVPQASPRRGARVLNLSVPADLELLRSMLASRAPVSATCGSRDPGWLFLIDLALWGATPPVVAHVGALGCIVVYELRDGVLRLHDVIARDMPRLSALLPFVAHGCSRVEVFFTADASSDLPLRPAATSLYDFLMVRGAPFPANVPLCLSPLSRC